jgi:hypothetical protein
MLLAGGGDYISDFAIDIPDLEAFNSPPLPFSKSKLVLKFLPRL